MLRLTICRLPVSRKTLVFRLLKRCRNLKEAPNVVYDRCFVVWNVCKYKVILFILMSEQGYGELACGSSRKWNELKITLTWSYEMFIDSESPQQEWSLHPAVGKDWLEMMIITPLRSFSFFDFVWMPHLSGENFYKIAPSGQWSEVCLMRLLPMLYSLDHLNVFVPCSVIVIIWLGLRQCVWLIPVLFSSYYHRCC